MSKFSEMVKKMNELKAELSANLQEAFNEAIQEAFDQNPMIGRVFWRQYTPYFNDGDPCYFRVGDLWTCYNFPEGAVWPEDHEEFEGEVDLDELIDHEDGECNAPQQWAYWKALEVGYKDGAYGLKEGTEEEKAEFTEIDRQETNVLRAINEFEDFFEELFDDHVKVAVYRDAEGKVETSTEEYYHD